jgi:hypothetical protein
MRCKTSIKRLSNINSNMTYYHIHHILPKHMGGKNDSNNLKKVTIKQHSLEHKKLYEKYGHWEDLVAWKSLSGQYTNKQTIREVRIKSNIERWSNPNFKEKVRKKISEAHKKLNKKIPKGCNFKGKNHTEEYKQKRRLEKIAYWSNPENRKKASERTKKIRKHILWNKNGRL